MKNIYRLFILVLLLLVVSCATTQGTVSNSVYQSPLGNFSVPLPSGTGMKIQDQNDNEGGRVSFHDDFGNLSAITYLRLPANSESTFTDNEKRDSAYGNFLKNFAVPTLFSRASPNARTVHEEFIGEGKDRVFFAVVNLPEGSAMVDMKQNRRLDSVRGVFIFDRQGFIYMLEHEMNGIFSKVNPSSLTPQQLESAQSSLKQIKGSMTFM